MKELHFIVCWVHYLVSHSGHDGGRWADKPDTSLHAGLGKVRPLGQKSVAGMDRVNVMLLQEKKFSSKMAIQYTK